MTGNSFDFDQILRLRDGNVDLDPGEFIVIPRGVEHRPEALTDEAHVVLLEPNTTRNTGNVTSERTVTELAWVAGTGLR